MSCLPVPRRGALMLPGGAKAGGAQRPRNATCNAPAQLGGVEEHCCCSNTTRRSYRDAALVFRLALDLSVHIHTSSARRRRPSTRPTRRAAHNTTAALPSDHGKGCPRCSGKPSIMTTSQQDTTPRNYWKEVQYDGTGGATCCGTFQCYGGCGGHQRAASSRCRCGTLLLTSPGET